MKILAIETSTKHFSLAVSIGSRKIKQKNILLKGVLSSSIIPAIEQILKTSGIKAQELDGFAVGLGPGSFTSLRVGLSTIKALAFALGKPIVGISSLDVLVMNIKDKSAAQICVINDARRNLIYAGLYRNTNGQTKKVSGPHLLTIEELLPKIKGSTIFVGDAIPLFQERIAAVLGSRAIFAESKQWNPQAKELVALSQQRLHNKEFNAAETLVPLYLYPEDCQVKK